MQLYGGGLEAASGQGWMLSPGEANMTFSYFTLAPCFLEILMITIF